MRPRGRYGHVLVPVAPDRVLLFAGETASGIVNDAWVLSGASSAASAAVPTVTAWHQLETEGTALSARKGHGAACACHLRSLNRRATNLPRTVCEGAGPVELCMLSTSQISY